MSTVPMFAPDGTLGDIPYEKMQDALKAGAKPAINMKSPDGKMGAVPADRLSDAVKAGGTIIPFGEQETQHPGFWHAVASDLAGYVTGLPGAVRQAGRAAFVPGAAGPETVAPSLEQDQARKQAGYSPAYRAVAPLGQVAGLNVPGMEQSAAEGDVAGVAGHAAAPVAAAAIVRGAQEAKAATIPEGAGATVAAKLRQLTPKQAAQVIGGVSGGVAGHGTLSAPGAYYGAKTAGGLAEGVLGKERANAPIFGKPAATPEAAPAVTAPTPVEQPPAQPRPMPVDNAPQTLSGESALRQVLTGQDNANLLKIAKSRGINVTKESQLKPGIAGNLIINKIMDDFSPEELEEIRAQYLENSRFKHNFGDVGPEAWKTMSLQTYFPDLKLSSATLARTAKAITKAGDIQLPSGTSEQDLTPLLQESLKRFRATRAAKAQAAQ